jgi:hypothetical protein
MTFLRKEGIVIQHYCKNPQQELKDLQIAFEFSKKYIAKTAKNLQTYETLLQGLKEQKSTAQLDCLTLEILIHPQLSEDYDVAFQHTNLRILIHETIIEIAAEKVKIVTTQLKGKEADLNFKAYVSKLLTLMLNFSKSLVLK